MGAVGSLAWALHPYFPIQLRALPSSGRVQLNRQIRTLLGQSLSILSKAPTIMSDPSSSSCSAAALPSLQSVAEPEPASGTAISDINILEAWHREYTTANPDRIYEWDPFIKAIESDKLDHHLIETQVRQLVSSMDVSQGFCTKCRYLFSHWPALSDDNDAVVGRHFHTQEIEAAAKAGCKCCTFLLSFLTDLYTLDLLRKVEVRLHTLGETDTFSLSIQSHDWLERGVQRLWVNWPGKIEHDTRHVENVFKFWSHMIEPTCKCVWLTCLFRTN